MSTTDIRESINAALAHEARTNDFQQQLQQRLPALRSKLEFPKDSAEDALLAFVIDYVESVPGCLSLVTAVSKQLGFFDYAAPFLHMAEDYFLCPPGELPDVGGLEAVLDEAFLAHRLLEEVNDHHVRHVRRPLLPLDMTEANLIVHHLLGDEFATRLERLVQFAASNLLQSEHVWAKVKSLPGTDAPTPPLVDSTTLTGSPQQIRLRLAS